MKLSTKYLIVILLSVLIFPLSYFGVNLSYYLLVNLMGSMSNEQFISSSDIEEEWGDFLHGLKSKRVDFIVAELEQFDRYPDFNLHWINDEGDVLYSNNEEISSNHWNATEAIDFILDEKNDPYYTNFSYLRSSDGGGYMILQVPKRNLGTKWEVLDEKYSSFWYLFLLSTLGLFVYITWFFFKQTSSRLVKIQSHMEENKFHLVPSKMVVKKKDEIGALEESFNLMVDNIHSSHQKEKKEMVIRKRLIASLSHDLRTPLAIINGHVHKLQDADLNEEGRESLDAIMGKVTFLGELIDNLSSYTVLSEGRLPLTLEKRDIVPIIRKALIDWYPIFEENHFQIDITLHEPIHWEIDETWLLRVLNNLFQNVKRHASEGKYISVKTEKVNGCESIRIVDHGPGIEKLSDNRGEGIGLSIVAMMIEQMNLHFTISNRDKGTEAVIYKNSEAPN